MCGGSGAAGMEVSTLPLHYSLVPHLKHAGVNSDVRGLWESEGERKGGQQREAVRPIHGEPGASAPMNEAHVSLCSCASHCRSEHIKARMDCIWEDLLCNQLL